MTMTQVVIGGDAERQLQSVTESAELITEDGRVLGIFRGVWRPPYPPEMIPPMDPAERERRYAEPGDLTTDEVLQHLESL
jgi:predicted amidohydrolase